MPVVYLVRGECADYYCGSCGDGGHLLAVADTKEQAEQFGEQAKELEMRGTLYNVKVLGPFVIGGLVSEARV